MNRCYVLLLLILILASSAMAQRRETLQYYQADPNYYTLTAPLNSIFFSRFQTTAPCRIMKVSLGVVGTDPANGDSLEFVVLANDGGNTFPYRLMLLSLPYKFYVAAGYNGNIDINFSTPLVIDKPTSFFVGVRRGWQNATLKMDAVTQTPACTNADGDTMITSAFAIFDPTAKRYSFGSKFTSGDYCNNWYISVDVEYFNESPSTYFANVTPLAGLDAANPARRMSWGDYNNDGYQDLLLGNKLYRNKGDGTFEDVSASVGYNKGSQVNMFVDVDNDGDLDIVCEPDNLVYMNNGGTFSLKANNGLATSMNTRSMAFADYDGDKFPDFFCANGQFQYVKNPNNPNDSALVQEVGYQSHLYKGNGDGSFVDKTSGTTLNGYGQSKIGFNPYNNKQEVTGYRDCEGAMWSDFDNDGDLDLYVAAGHGMSNYLFMNQGAQKFLDQALSKSINGNYKVGSNWYGDSYGCEWADYDNDGFMDLLVGNSCLAPFYSLYDKTSLYKNNGPGTSNYSFADQQPAAGLLYNEWDTDVAWGDFNNDGLLDCYITSSKGCHESALYQQNPDHTFSEVTYISGTKTSGAWGVTWVDYDNDGDLDLAVISDNGFLLFRNDVNNGKSWSKLTLKSTTGNDYAIGARVTALVNGVKQTREVSAGKGAGSQNPYVVHFGLDIYPKIDELTIKWPKGNVDTYIDFPARKDSVITEKPASAKPTISLSTTNVNFGNVAINKSSEQTVSVRNSGQANLILNEQTLINNTQNQFSITQAAVSPIAPNSQSDIKVKFAPTSQGTKTAQLRIGSNDPNYPSVLVDLNGNAIVSVKELPGVPTTTMLYQNYPNPFTASSEIRYDIAEEANVSIRIYNSVGSVVGEIVNASHRVGSYSASFDAISSGMQLPSGTYTAVMEVNSNKGTQRFTRTMILVR